MRRRTRRLLGGGCAVVIAAGLLLGGNAVVTSRAETRIDAALACAVGTGAASVSAHIAGWPVSTQVLRGRLDTVDAQVATAQAELHLHLTDVELASPATVGHATATATVPWATLSARLTAKTGTAVTLGASGDLLSASPAAGGMVSALFRVDHDADSVTLTAEDLAIGGRRVPVSALGGVGGSRLATLTKTRTLRPDLPTGSRIRSATPESDGLHVVFALSTGALSASGGSESASCAS